LLLNYNDMKIRSTLSFVSLVFIFSSLLFPCEYCFVTQHGYVYDLNRTSLRIDSRYQFFSGLETPTIDRVRSVHSSTFFTVSYSADVWGITLAVPFIYRTQENTFDGSSTLHYNHSNRPQITGVAPSIVERNIARGIGDMTILARYAAYQGGDESEGTFYNLFIQGGLKSATGTIDSRDQYGYLLHPHLQNGTGTANILFGANGMIGNFSTSVALNLLAGIPLSSANLFQESSALNYDITLRHRIYPDDPEEGLMVIANGGLIGRLWGKEKYRGSTLLDSGGNYLFTNTGISIYPLPSISIDIQYQLPIIKNLLGNQLNERYRIASGVGIML